MNQFQPYEGKKNDFDIYKSQKNRDRFHGVPKKADSGYQGIKNYDKGAEIPFKKPKKGELTTEQKTYNHELSKKRIKVENVIREVKIFKILSDSYRNRRKNYSIKTNIVAGISNFRLSFCISLARIILYILFIEKLFCKYAFTTTQFIVNFDSKLSYSLDIN